MEQKDKETLRICIALVLVAREPIRWNDLMSELKGVNGVDVHEVLEWMIQEDIVEKDLQHGSTAWFYRLTEPGKFVARQWVLKLTQEVLGLR